MVRTQIQLPDELYRKLKQIAEFEEWSLTETIRRAAEELLGAYPRVGKVMKNPPLPETVDLGEPLVPEEKWAEVLMQDRLNRIMGIKMESCDANILCDSLNRRSPFFDAARGYIAGQWENDQFVVCELALTELYGLLRNAVIMPRPLSAQDAADKIQEFRSNLRWRVYDYPGGLMNDVWDRAAGPDFARTGVYDARFALTLRHYGVTHFATRNVKHFQDYGFEKVFDPTA